MVEGMFGRGALPALEAMVRFAAARHRVIAANIAHVDTAGYQARDLSVEGFKAALARSFEAPVLDLRPGLAADTGPLKENGNNVDLDMEMGRMVRNATVHQTAASLLAHQFAMMREALAERVLG